MRLFRLLLPALLSSCLDLNPDAYVFDLDGGTGGGGLGGVKVYSFSGSTTSRPRSTAGTFKTSSGTASPCLGTAGCSS
ncbi:MAG: hypothetical protein Q8S33_13205 [Myxococcales bacterium]|nr:hypothetical protein [Myxococcales bacterium]